MNKGQIHPSSQLYQEFIVNAFLELAKEKKISKITITELCERADVSRRTFYRHFEKKEDVVECYTMNLMKALANALTPAFIRNDMYEFTKSFFEFFIPEKEHLRFFTENGFGDIIFTCYIKSMVPLTYMHPLQITAAESTANNTECKMAYILGGLWSLLTYWLSHGCVQTPEELADTVMP